MSTSGHRETNIQPARQFAPEKRACGWLSGMPCYFRTFGAEPGLRGESELDLHTIAGET